MASANLHQKQPGFRTVIIAHMDLIGFKVKVHSIEDPGKTVVLVIFGIYMTNYTGKAFYKH